MSFNKCNNTNPTMNVVWQFIHFAHCVFMFVSSLYNLYFNLHRQLLVAIFLPHFWCNHYSQLLTPLYFWEWGPQVVTLLFTQKSIVFSLYICHVFRLCVKARHSYANCWLCSSSSRPLNSISKSDVSFRDVSTERLLLASFFIVFSCRVRLAFVIPTAAIFA